MYTETLNGERGYFMEKCKFCQEELAEGSTVCPHCGKDDVTIDSGNRTVTFSCKASVEQNGIDTNHSAGEILLSYTEAENGNYVNVSLKS